MKHLILLLPLLAALLFPAPPLAASAADGRYAVCEQDVWFYAGASEEERLFLIPDTYYVRVLEEGEVYSTVEYLVDDPPYKKLLGYCRTDQLLFVDFIPVRPYLRKQITVTYTLPEAGDLGDDAFTSVERTFVYYGDRYESGQLYLYVLLDGTFGYIPADAPPEYEHNTDYLTATSGDGETDQTPAAESPVSATQIVVICLACGAAVAITIILMRGKRRQTDEPQDF